MIWKSSSWRQVDSFVYTYNDFGALTSKTGGNGKVLYSATYDGLLKTSETDENGVVTSFTYDVAGRVATSTRKGLTPSDDLVTRFVYDAGGNVLEQHVGWGRSETMVTAKMYDDAGRVTAEFPPGNFGAVTHTYDAASRSHTVFGRMGVT